MSGVEGQISAGAKYAWQGLDRCLFGLLHRVVSDLKKYRQKYKKKSYKNIKKDYLCRSTVIWQLHTKIDKFKNLMWFLAWMPT